jgi:hypothetical protein
LSILLYKIPLYGTIFIDIKKEWQQNLPLSSDQPTNTEELHVTTKENTIKEIQTRQELKIRRLKSRQEAREKDGLYHPNSIEGEDYIICPITNVRFTKIKKGHITGTLGITEDEYYELFPELKGKVANRLKKRISEGQKTKMAFYDDGSPVLDKDGKHLTGDQWGRLKARQKLNEIDPETGMRGYDKLGEKTRNSHLSKVDENGLNGYQRIAKEAIHKGNKTKLDKGIMSRNWSYPFERYERMVEYLLKYVKPALTNNGEIVLSKVTDDDDGWQIDHKYSIAQGWKDRVSPFIIGSVFNLDLIKKSQNRDKCDSCSIELDELLSLCGYSMEESIKEFDVLYDLFKDDHSNGIPVSSLYTIEKANLYERLTPFIDIKNKYTNNDIEE